MKILLAVDGSDCSDAAAEELAKRPWPPQSEVKVITAVEIPAPVGMEPWAMSPDYFENLEIAVRQAAQAILDSTLLKLKAITDKTLKISSEIIQGSPAQVIVDEAGALGSRSHHYGFTGVRYLESTIARFSIECGGPSREVLGRGCQDAATEPDKSEPVSSSFDEIARKQAITWGGDK